MKYIIINDRKYYLLEDYKNGFEINIVSEKLTDYFSYFDYIVGDWSYGKLRLKGFCKKANNNRKEINDFNKKNQYIKNHCAYDCKYFVLENLEVIQDKIPVE